MNQINFFPEINCLFFLFSSSFRFRIFQICGKTTLSISFYFLINLFQYIRLIPETDQNDVINLFHIHWKLSEPDVIISVFGDDQISRLNPKLAAMVSEGLTLVRIGFTLDCAIIRSKRAIKEFLILDEQLLRQ